MSYLFCHPLIGLLILWPTVFSPWFLHQSSNNKHYGCLNIHKRRKKRGMRKIFMMSNTWAAVYTHHFNLEIIIYNFLYKKPCKVTANFKLEVSTVKHQRANWKMSKLLLFFATFSLLTTAIIASAIPDGVDQAWGDYQVLFYILSYYYSKTYIEFILRSSLEEAFIWTNPSKEKSFSPKRTWWSRSTTAGITRSP